MQQNSLEALLHLTHAWISRYYMRILNNIHSFLARVPAECCEFISALICFPQKYFHCLSEKGLQSGLCEIILTTDDRSSYRLVVYLAGVLSELVIIERQLKSRSTIQSVDVAQELLYFPQINYTACSYRLLSHVISWELSLSPTSLKVVTVGDETNVALIS